MILVTCFMNKDNTFCGFTMMFAISNIIVKPCSHPIMSCVRKCPMPTKCTVTMTFEINLNLYPRSSDTVLKADSKSMFS